jgi:hypothetical protein
VFFARGMRLGKKWWQSFLRREISCSQWESPSILSKCLGFFPLSLGEGGKDFFHFSLVPNVFLLCSIQVPIKLPLFWGSSIVSFQIEWWTIKLAAHCPKKKKKNTWEAPHLINRKVYNPSSLLGA